jgi:hypothetical protein
MVLFKDIRVTDDEKSLKLTPESYEALTSVFDGDIQTSRTDIDHIVGDNDDNKIEEKYHMRTEKKNSKFLISIIFLIGVLVYPVSSNVANDHCMKISIPVILLMFIAMLFITN